MPNILVACEESQVVTCAFRDLGFTAFSCDLQPCSGPMPKWHLCCDATKILNAGWDLIIAFPPCTHLARSGACWWPLKRSDGRQQRAVSFFLKFVNANCPHIAIENPVGLMNKIWQQPNQIIQPYQFGHLEMKKTCLWLKNLPKLKPTSDFEKVTKMQDEKIKQRTHYSITAKERSKLRSRTFFGIAEAMAMQWGYYLLTKLGG